MSIMHTVRAGTGAPPLLFVHGFTCAHTDWEPQLAHFSKQHAVAACDLRGHGATPGTPADVTIENFGADVAQLLVELNWTNAVLVGHSMGCRVVMQAALDAPDRVGAIVLVDGSALGSGDPQAAERDMSAKIRAIGFPAMAAGMFGEMFVAASDPTRKAAILARASNFPAEIGLALFPRTVGWDARNLERALKTLRVPILAIQSTSLNAERKRVQLKAGDSTPYLDQLRRLNANVRTVIVPGAGHFTGLDAADVVNREIGALVASLNR